MYFRFVKRIKKGSLGVSIAVKKGTMAIPIFIKENIFNLGGLYFQRFNPCLSWQETW